MGRVFDPDAPQEGPSQSTGALLTWRNIPPTPFVTPKFRHERDTKGGFSETPGRGAMTVLSGLGHKARASIQIVWAVFISSSYLALAEQQQRKGRIITESPLRCMPVEMGSDRNPPGGRDARHLTSDW